ncbi:MAG TPA: hypothetical protein VHU92_10115 [Streptosporangiaceae bacterium]|jgi:hypothetical protein|nr:hypothetical protein [Streptosporangiaceae bacterium]
MSSHAVFGGGLWFLFFWLSTLLAIFYVAVPVLAVGLSVWLATFRARRDVPRWLIRRARVGRLTGVGVGASAGIVLTWFGQAMVAPAAVGVGYLSGVLIAELLAVPRPSGPLRVASLQPRNARRYLPRWAVSVAVAAAVPVLASPLAVTVTEHYDRADAVTSALFLPLAVVAALALGLGFIALRRVELVPSAGRGGPEVEEGVRRNTARAVAGAVIGIELLLLAAQAVLLGDELSSSVEYQASPILLSCAAALAFAAVLVWCVLGWWKRVPPPESAFIPAGPKPPEPSIFQASKIA